MAPAPRPYGSWPSPLTADEIVKSSLRLGGLALGRGDCCWIEGRAAEAGRNVLVRALGGTCTDLTPAPFNVRTRVHEYGGGAAAVGEDLACFVHFEDQQIYVQAAGASPRRLTDSPDLRFADLVLDPAHDRIVCVVESRAPDDIAGGDEPANYLAAVRLSDGRVEVLARGHDFFSSPALGPNADALAWLSWDHPRMPWDGTELWQATIAADGRLGEPRRVAGGAEVSVFQPAWSPAGDLHFVADPNGWWNLYRLDGGRVCPVHEGSREMGRPQWAFGMRTYAFVPGEPGSIVCAYAEQGRWRLGRISSGSPDITPYALPYTDIGDLVVAGEAAYLIAGAPDQAAAVVRVDLADGTATVLRRSAEVAMAPESISEPRPIRFPTDEGDQAHGLYYPPRSAQHVGPEDARPPLIVIGHGGPTGSASRSFNPGIQYWTTRGFAVLDVDYRGSTGYGRAYRERLHGAWGVRDVADCVNGARHLVQSGEVDGARLAIRGGSAGGYTALAALTFHDVFTAGASYYGISELEALARDTHKFESRYLDALIGPYPEARSLYRDRSPIHFTDRLSCPVIFFQGCEDRVVPPNQAEMMVAALEAKGLPVAYLAFPGEQHGFRAAETIKRTLEAELYFYGRIFGFEPADPLQPVDIVGLR